MQQNPVPTLGKLLLLACVLVLLLLACELDPPMFSFSYDANGAQSGDLPAPVSLHKGGSTITVAGNTGNLIKPNFSFNSWNTKQDGSGKTYLPGDTFTLAREDVVLYAQWNPNPSYKTTYYRQNADNDDYTLHETENLSGAVNTAAIPVHKIYAGFTENTNHPNTLASGTILADGSLVLKLYYDRNTFTVSFQTNSTATISDLTNQKYGAKIAKPNDPTRQGYTFSGWYKEASLTNPWDFLADTITTNTTLYAKWAASNTTSYTVEHYTQDLNLSTYSMAELETLSGPTATVVNATYKTYPGFTKDESNANTQKSGTIAGDGSLVLRLCYTRNTFIVSFQTNSTATISDLTNQPYGATMAKPTDPTRQGYTFSGWYKEATLATAWNFTNDTIQTTTTLYAKWSPNTTTPYTVKYYLQDTNGTTYTLQETVAKTGTTATTGTSEAKTYSGFTENTSKSERLTEAAILPDGSLILKRYYDRNTYTLTFAANGGSGTQVTQDLKYQTSTQLTANSYTRAGYSFAGWATQANGTGTNYTDKASYSIGAGTVTLYAQWTANTYTVIFDKQGGTTPAPATKTVSYDGTYGTLATTSRDGYTFAGWYTATSGGDKIENTTTVSTQADQTLYAHWTADSYAITYSLNGGTNAVSNPDSYAIQTPTITLAVPTKPNYTFDGWYTSSTFSGSPVTSIDQGSTGTKAFYAKWTPTSYTITYYLDGGTNAALNPGSYTIVTPTIILDDPTKTHYDFWGWYETSDFSGSAVSTIANGSFGNKTLYAKWLPTYNLVIFKPNGGSSFMDDQSIRYTYQATLDANAFTLTGYSFNGWNTQADGSGTSYADEASITMGSEHLTLYAQWAANTYTVSFDGQRGAVPDPTSKRVTFGSSYGELQTTSRTGYTFAGWYTAASGGDKIENTSTVSVDADHTLYAHWTANNYAVTFAAQGGTTPSQTTKDVTFNNTYETLATTTRSGYTFAGWFTAASGGDKVESTTAVTTSSSHTLYAQWTANTYTVSFDGQGGSAPNPSSKQVTFGSAYGSFATSSRDGYTLAGWYHSSIGSSSLFTESSLVALAEDHTLLAHWDAITYDIAYTLNGGTNSQDNPAHYSIESETITLAAPTRDGYDFVGWYADVNLSIPQPLISKGSMGNKTLYAKWAVAFYSVSYELDSGTNAPGNPTVYTILENTITLLNPTRSHYTFGGWYTTSEFTGTAVTSIPSGSFGDKTFYAKWLAIPYQITYVLNEGTNASANPNAYTFESPDIALAAPTRLHYDFWGWYETPDFTGSTVLFIYTGSSGAKTLYAKWSPNTTTPYTVNYYLQDTDGSTYTLQETVAKTGTTATTGTSEAKTYSGFTENTTKSERLISSAILPDGSLILKRYYDRNTYTLTFDANGGSGTQVTQDLKYQTSTALTANSYTRTGYSFAGWNTQANGTGTNYGDKASYSIGAGTVTLYAQWTAKTYTVTFDEQGGTTPVPATNTVAYDSTYGSLATTSRDGYTFAGWYTASSGGMKIETTSTVATASNHLLYARWTANNATAYKTEHYKQNLNDAGYTPFETENLSGVTDTVATAVYMTYTGFTKDESNASTVASGTIAGNGSLVLKLYYTRNTYTVSFASNGGSSVSDLINQKYEAKVIKPNNPTKQGYSFSGWYKEAALTTAWDFASDIVQADTTLYAKWTADSYSITYTLNGGTNASSNPATYTIETPTITLAEPTKTHYTFDGWYTSSAFLGSPVASILEGSTGAKAFYAKWTPTSYTITYDLDGGTNAVTNPPSYTIETTTITLDDPTKTHYDFWGWYETSDFSGTPITTIAAGSSGAKTLYAKWLPTYNLVIFKPNGGSSFMDDQSIRYTYQATLDANAFTLTGYSFTGWNTQADGSGTSYADEASITMGSEHLTLYAQWAANTYTVSFDGQGGAVPDPTSKRVTFGSSYGELPTTSRTGYTFAGWYTAASGGDKIENTSSVSVDADQTLYARWTANTYTVTFAAEGGTTPSQTTKDVTFKSTYETLATTSRTGYTFAGWYTATSGGDKVESTITVTTAADHTLYAQWTANTYTVTFDGQGGSAPDPSSKQVTFGSAYGSFATSSRDGYTLAGWSHSSIGSSSLFTESSLVALAEDHTLLAHWDAITYDIAYTLNGGTNSQDNPAHYSIESETITLAAPTRDGYDFVGWYADVNLSIPQPLIPKGSVGNKTLYAKWAVAFYSVSYELNSGANAQGNPTAYTILENTITLLNPTRSHYTFGGWYTTSEFTGTAVTSIPSGSFGDKTFYAKWLAIPYQITYVLNEGTNASANPNAYTFESPDIALAAPTRLHYDFWGWYETPDFTGSTVLFIYTGSSGAKTLYAKWSLAYYLVHFNANNGSGLILDQALLYNTQTALDTNTFTRTGYSFTGWNTQANGLGTSYTDKALYTIGGADVNLYAQWQKNTYTLTFNKNDGTNTTKTQTLLYATSTPLTANTYTRTGYNFAGWNTQSNGSGTSYADKANYSIGAANATLYAKWTPLTISIAFDEEGGTTTSPETIYRDYNTAYGTLPTTTRTGYTFAGWWTGDNGTGTQVISTTTVTATNWHTLYAKWNPNTNTAYKVEHYQQDVSGAGYTLFETENKTGTTAIQVTATAKTYAGFNYNTTMGTATGTIVADGSLVLRLYYDRKTYAVTFQSNGGSAVSAYTGVRHGATISAPADPTRSSYVFNLWYADSNLTQRFDFATQTITADTMLYAKWWSGGVGDLGPAGGVVFHDKGVYSDGWRYLEAASTDVVDAYHKGETTYEWGGKTTYLYHINYTLIGTSLAIGTGEANSLAMIAALSKYSYIYSGADLCREVYQQGGYSDWFLPSVLELDKMARLTDAKAGAFTLLSGVYWSSSESSSSNAYLYASAGKSYSPMPKDNLFQLRAARAF